MLKLFRKFMYWIFNIIKRILISRIFMYSLLSIFCGITALSPNILSNPQVLINYIGLIILSSVVQEIDAKEKEKKWKLEISHLQKQIDKLGHRKDCPKP